MLGLGYQDTITGGEIEPIDHLLGQSRSYRSADATKSNATCHSGSVAQVCYSETLLALRAPEYGYALLKRLGAAGILSDANTIYPLLRRLEERGLLASEWNTEARFTALFPTPSADSVSVPQD